MLLASRATGPHRGHGTGEEGCAACQRVKWSPRACPHEGAPDCGCSDGWTSLGAS